MGAELVVFGPDGRRFLTFEELDAERRAEPADVPLSVCAPGSALPSGG
jgi:hypothetical protein